MRYLYFLLLLVTQTAFAQCCPYLQPVQVLPANPTAADNIRLVFQAATGNRGSQINANMVRTSNAFAYTGCYYSGFLTQPQSYTDTVRIGRLAAGSYSVSFLGLQSSNIQQCQEQQRNTTSGTFQVRGALATRVAADGWSVFPVPSINRVLTLAVPTDNAVKSLQLLDATGRTCFAGNAALLVPRSNQWELGLPALPTGVYTLQITPMNGTLITQRIVVQ